MFELAAAIGNMNSEHDIKPFDKINGFLITPWAGLLTIIMTIEEKDVGICASTTECSS